jgi:hypothetical protein
MRSNQSNRKDRAPKRFIRRQRHRRHEGARCDHTTPSSGARVTFAVGSELFRVALTSADQVAAARAAQSGGGARIPIGRVVEGTQVNTGWSWHLQDVTFTEAAIELCDGRPTDVEREGIQFGGGRFCPWSATVVRID